MLGVRTTVTGVERMQLNCALDKAEGTKVTTRTAARLGGFVGFIGGFMMAYQRSSGTSLATLSLLLFHITDAH